MTRRAVDLKRARVLAETSLRRIASLQHGADPKSYALWYSVAAGDNATLRHAVDQLIARKRGLSRQDVDSLHDTHVAPNNAAEKVEQVGAQFANEIAKLAGMVEAAREVAATYSRKLGDVRRSLDSIRDREGARAAVGGLLAAARDMEADHVTLRARLTSSWRGVVGLRGTLDAVRKDSLADPLTMLGNRHYFNRCLAGAVDQCRVSREPLSLLLVGIDRLRQVNDVHGELIGDRVLRFVAMTLERVVKDNDIVARYGGDEFGIVLPKSRLTAAVKLAQHIRAAIISKELLKHLTHGKRSSLTVSIGAAALDRGGTAQALTEAAELCLFAAKRAGRNRVIAETDEALIEALTGKVA